MTLEQRVSRLERELDDRRQKAADRRMWLRFYGWSSLIGIGAVALAYLVAR